MERIRLIGMENSDQRSVFVFEKTPAFFSLFSQFLETIGLEPLHELYNDHLTIDDATDSVDNRASELYDVDVFYGEKCIVVVIRTPVPREQYLPHIKRIATWSGFDA